MSTRTTVSQNHGTSRLVLYRTYSTKGNYWFGSSFQAAITVLPELDNVSALDHVGDGLSLRIEKVLKFVVGVIYVHLLPD